MNAAQLTDKIMSPSRLDEAANRMGQGLTLALQSLLEGAIADCVDLDPAGQIGKCDLSDPHRVEVICKLSAAYRDYQAGEAARRQSTRPLPPPQINLPPSINAGGVKVAPTGPPNG